MMGAEIQHIWNDGHHKALPAAKHNQAKIISVISISLPPITAINSLCKLCNDVIKQVPHLSSPSNYLCRCPYLGGRKILHKNRLQDLSYLYTLQNSKCLLTISTQEAKKETEERREIIFKWKMETIEFGSIQYILTMQYSGRENGRPTFLNFQIC